MTISQSFVPPPPVLGLVSRTRPVSASSPAVFGSGPHNITPGCGTVSQQDSQIGYFSSDCSNGHTHPDYSVCLCVCVCVFALSDNDNAVPNSAVCGLSHFILAHTRLGESAGMSLETRKTKKSAVNTQQITNLEQAGRVGRAHLMAAFIWTTCALEWLSFSQWIVYLVSSVFLSVRWHLQGKQMAKYIHNYCWMKSSGLVFEICVRRVWCEPLNVCDSSSSLQMKLCWIPVFKNVSFRFLINMAGDERLSFTRYIICGFEYSRRCHMGAAGLIRVIDFKCCMTAPLMLANMCGAGTRRPARHEPWLINLIDNLLCAAEACRTVSLQRKNWWIPSIHPSIHPSILG